MSKAFPQIQIKQYPDDQPGFEKPYLGYHRGKGMPSAREPLEQLDLSGPNAWKKYPESKIYITKNVKKCKKKCEFRTEKKSNSCAIHFNVKKCLRIKVNKKIVKPNYKPPLKGLGTYDEN